MTDKELHAYTVWVESSSQHRYVVVAESEEEASKLVGVAVQANVGYEDGEYEALQDKVDELEEQGAFVMEDHTDLGAHITEVKHFISDDERYVKRVTEKT